MISRTLPLCFLLACKGGTAEVNEADADADSDTDTDADTDADADTDTDTDTDADIPPQLTGWCTGQDDDLSFFVTSMAALWALSDSAPNDLDGGFGGDFGGIAGADAICQGIGAAVGHGDRDWRAFLSATDDGTGSPVHAIERIGTGPWTDANGRLVATGIAGLLADDRPDGDAQSVSDLPDECGVPLTLIGDSHDVLTGSDDEGRLNSTDPESTCNDWTSSSDSVGVGSGGQGPGSQGPVMCGHSFPRGGGGGGGPGGNNGASWLSDHPVRGCGKGANLIQDGPGSGTCVGCSGGYGALYCFAAD